MKFDEFRNEMESYRRQVAEEAACLKDWFIVRRRLIELYSRFDSHERIMANQVLAEWALSDDEAMRFDALGLIKDLKIVTAMSALQALAKRLSREETPGAPFELEKVERIMTEIAQEEPS